MNQNPPHSPSNTTVNPNMQQETSIATTPAPTPAPVPAMTTRIPIMVSLTKTFQEAQAQAIAAAQQQQPTTSSEECIRKVLVDPHLTVGNFTRDVLETAGHWMFSVCQQTLKEEKEKKKIESNGFVEEECKIKIQYGDRYTTDAFMHPCDANGVIVSSSSSPPPPQDQEMETEDKNENLKAEDGNQDSSSVVESSTTPTSSKTLSTSISLFLIEGGVCSMMMPTDSLWDQVYIPSPTNASSTTPVKPPPVHVIICTGKKQQMWPEDVNITNNKQQFQDRHHEVELKVNNETGELVHIGIRGCGMGYYGSGNGDDVGVTHHQNGAMGGGHSMNALPPKKRMFDAISGGVKDEAALVDEILLAGGGGGGHQLTSNGTNAGTSSTHHRDFPHHDMIQQPAPLIYQPATVPRKKAGTAKKSVEEIKIEMAQLRTYARMGTDGKLKWKFPVMTDEERKKAKTRCNHFSALKKKLEAHLGYEVTIEQALEPTEGQNQVAESHEEQQQQQQGEVDVEVTREVGENLDQQQQGEGQEAAAKEEEMPSNVAQI